MLKIIKIQHRSQIQEIFQSFDPTKTTWLVSDLRTKFELQSLVLKKQSFLKDESIYRASDLWKLFLRRLDPELQLVSDAFIRSVLRDFLDSNSELLEGLNASSESTLMAYIDQMSSIIFHPDGYHQLQAWFQQHPESALRWQNWFLRARICANYLVLQNKLITASWIVSYLQTFHSFEHVWSHDLVVDLGGELSSAEAEVLKQISSFVGVTVIVPEPSWSKEFSYILKPYSYLESHSKEVKRLPSQVKVAQSFEVHRLTGMLAEVQWTTSQIRQWLESGVPAQNISVIAPDIEAYWPVLSEILKHEGIPVQKAINGRLQSIPELSRWVATLRVRSRQVSSEDLELSYYGEGKAQMRSECFKALFGQLFVFEDLFRNSEVERVFQKTFEPAERISCQEFLIRALSFWTGTETQFLQTLLREFLAQSPEGLQLPWTQWLRYLEAVLAQKEFTIRESQAEGIHCTKIQSASSFQFSHRIFIGLAEENLKRSSRLQLMNQEYFDIQKDLGFNLENPDVSSLDFELRYLVDSPSQQDVYLFGASDFSGKLLSPSLFWLEKEKERKEILNLEMTRLSRWDELQRGSLELSPRMRHDLGLEDITPFAQGALRSISPSRLDEYLQCPFVFAAKKIFRLEDHPEVDLDVDKRTRGQLAHALFEKLVSHPMRYDWTDEELIAIIEECRAAGGEIQLADPRLWDPLKRRYLSLARRFLIEEKSLRSQLDPRYYTVGKEVDLQFYYDSKQGTASSTSSNEGIKVTVRLDRLDGNGDYWVVLDYKSSESVAPSKSSWLSERHLQMLFYMWALEKIGFEGQSKPVVGLFYYVFRNFKRKGFGIEEFGGQLFPPAKRKDKEGTWEGKEQLLAGFEEILNTTLEAMDGGAFAPKPFDEKNCERCRWSQVCRAPHLN